MFLSSPKGVWTRMLVGVMMFGAPAAGQQGDIGEMSPDRPGLTDPTGVVPQGVLQTEFGFSWQWERHGDERRRLMTLGSPNIRLGIGRRTEIRFNGDGGTGVRTESGGITSSVMGRSDYSFGVKHRLWGERRLRPAGALLPSVSMPLGHRELTSFAFEPGVKLSLEKGLWADVSVTANLNWASRKGDDGRFAALAQSVSFAREAFWGFTAYGEVYRSAPYGRSEIPVYVFDGGVSRNLSRNIAIDVEIGRQVESRPNGWFIGFGVTFRHFLRGMAPR